MDMDNRVKGILATILSATYFGFQPMIMMTFYEGGGNSFTGTMLRYGLPIPICFVYLLINKIDLRLDKRKLLHVIHLSIFMSGTTLLLYLSYNYIPTGMATTIHFLNPTFTMIGSVVLYKTKVIKSKLVAIILCMIGIILFFDGEAGFSVRGFVLAFISSMTYAYYSIYLDHSDLNSMDSIKLIFYCNIVSTIFIFIIGLIFNNISFEVTSGAWTAIIIVAILNTFIGVLGYQIGIKYIGAESTSILSTCEPIVSVIVGYIVYSEVMTIRTIFACIAILVATIIVAREGKR